jgi:RNA recognition motif-containing protein
MTNIFVARLDFGVTESDLRTAFEAFGEVKKVSLAMDRETGKSKGFAFIEMAHADGASAAIAGLDGSTMNGRQIAVKQAENREDNRPKREGFQQNERPSYPRKEYDKGSTNLQSDYKKLDLDNKPKNVISPDLINPLKMEARKKEAPKKEVGKAKPKTHKMEAYKKSGKQNKFFNLDDEDEDFY